MSLRRRAAAVATSVAVAVAVAVTVSAAAMLPRDAVAQLRAAEFRLDNDQFAFIPRNEERWYTSGEYFRFAFDALPDAADARLMAAWCARVVACDRDAPTLRLLSLDHAIYTPAFTGTMAPQPSDRPYAASLALGAAIVSVGPATRQTLSLQLGTVGPAALGEQVQNAIHSVLGQPKVQGWGWQVRAQPLVQLGWSRLARVPLSTPGTDLVVRTAALLGNPVTQASVGLMLRAGALPVGPTWPGESIGVRETPGWHGFAGVEARAVARDALIDGDTYGYASKVDREPLGATAFVGASVGVTRDWRVELSLAIATVPFSTPVEGPLHRPQRVGSIGLRWQPAR